MTFSPAHLVRASIRRQTLATSRSLRSHAPPTPAATRSHPSIPPLLPLTATRSAAPTSHSITPAPRSRPARPSRPTLALSFSSSVRAPSLVHVAPTSTASSLCRHYSTADARPQQKACWACSTSLPLAATHCSAPSCKAIQPIPSSVDYFDLFGLDRQHVRFDVDVKDLQAKWRRLMRGTHPDLMAGKSEKEQSIAAQQSSLVNKAYRTLEDPLERALYILSESQAPVSESESLSDPTLLMEVMELRERLEDAQDEQEAAAIRAENRENISNAIADLSSAFSSTPPNLDLARELAIKLRYWKNIDQAAREWTKGGRVDMQH